MRLPTTDSLEELARFWDSHEITDFEEQLEEITEPILKRMQTPTARKGMAEAFNATPATLGRSAVKAARERR